MTKKFIYIICIFCLVISNLYVPQAYAKTLGDLKKELEEYEKDYNDNKEQQKLTEKEKEEIQSNIATIETEIVNIGTEIDELNNEIEDLNVEIDNLNVEIASKQQEIEDLLVFTQVSNGESAYLEYAFGAKDFTDFIYRIAVSEQLTAYNNQLVDEYKINIQENKKNIEENEKKTNELVVKQSTLTKKQDNLNEELLKLEDSLVEIDELSEGISDKIESVKKYIKIYTEKGCQDDESIETCGERLIPKDTSFVRPITTGYISGWFGARDCSDPRVSCSHKGLDMSASGANTRNIPIYPVADGMVVEVVELTYSNSKGRYNTICGGRKVYIEHIINGQIYTTGYLHLRRIDVKEGQIVTKETQIGLMGGYPGTEYWDNCSTGAHLHLEISRGTFPKTIFDTNTYYGYRYSATNEINFPRSKYVYWYDRTSYVK